MYSYHLSMVLLHQSFRLLSISRFVFLLLNTGSTMGGMWVRACAKITWQIELITVRPEVSKGSGGHSCFDTFLTDGRQASA
jgi:hypothetical protein